MGHAGAAQFFRRVRSRDAGWHDTHVLRQGGTDSTASHGWDGGKPGRIALPWKADAVAGGSVALTQDRPGKPWATLQSLAAVPLTAPWSGGYRIRRSIAMVEQKQPGMLSRGDICASRWRSMRRPT